MELPPAPRVLRTRWIALFGSVALVVAGFIGPAGTAAATTPTLTITASSSVILWGGIVGLTVHLGVPSGSTDSVANRTIHVQVSRFSSAATFGTISPGGDLVTDASGNATIASYRPATNDWFRAVFDGADNLTAATSAATRVVVRQLALIRPDNAGNVKTIRKGTTIEFKTTVRPSRAELPPADVTWQIWRLVDNHWGLFLTRVSNAGDNGVASLIVEFNTGNWRIRSQARPTHFNANSVWTPFVEYKVIK